MIAIFVQDKPALERGLFDHETVPEELTQVRLGKIIKDKYPELDAEDQEAVRQHAILAKSMSEESLKQVAAVIAAKKVSFTHEEAKGVVFGTAVCYRRSSGKDKGK